MHVDVHLARVNLNQQGYGSVAASRHGRSVGVIYALGQALGPYPPTVYRDRLARAAALGDARQRRVARDLEGALLVIHPAHRLRLAHTVELGEALDEVLGRGQREQLLALLGETEHYPRMGDGEVGQSLHYSCSLCTGAL